MINIGIDGHMIGDHSGGNESYSSNILKNMHKPDKFKFYLFVKDGIDTSEYEDTFEIVRFHSHNAFVRNFWELPVLCKRYKLSLLHTQYFIPFWRPCEVVCTIHDICFEHFKDIFTKKEYYRQKLLIPYAAKHSKKLFTSSQYSKDDIKEHYKIDDSDILVTHSAVNPSFRKLNDIELNCAELREKYGIGSSKFILSVCNLQPRKNLIRLIHSFVKMKKEYGGDEKLVVVGKKAWMFHDILKTAIDNTKEIIFTDYVDDRDLVRLYNEATCFIYPSFFEGFGIPLIEAMACGTPVAAANATSLPEVVEDAGIYFDPFDEEQIKEAMFRLLSDERLQNDLVEKGFKRVKQFEWKKSSDIILNTYEEVVM